MELLSCYPACEGPHTSLQLHPVSAKPAKECSPPILQFPLAIKKTQWRDAVELKNLFFLSLSDWFLFFSFFISHSNPPTRRRAHTQSQTGPRGNSEFPFMLLIIRACCYFMRPCKPLNYCTLKCIATLLRDRTDRRVSHWPSEGPGRWTTKEHDSLIIFNSRIKMVMKWRQEGRRREGAGGFKVANYRLVMDKAAIIHSFIHSFMNLSLFFFLCI